jgi:hypothetical protein
MNTNMVKVALLPALLLAACSSAPPQVVTGRVDNTTFPYAVDTVSAVRVGKTVVSAPIAADGSFSIAIPAGSRYRLEFAATGGRAGLVFPRTLGTLDTTFDVRGHQAAFDLGAVRFVGDPASHTYKTVAAPADGADGECENGIDPSTGAVCVDDEEDGGSCEASDGGIDCQDGIDPATGQECDGGPAANQDDGTEADGEDPTDDAPTEGAVADKNLPSAIGCGDEEDGEEGSDD